MKKQAKKVFKKKNINAFLHNINMSEKALKFGNVIVITKEFHTSKKLITLNLIDIVKNGKK